jgi:signal transduction histidine kinase
MFTRVGVADVAPAAALGVAAGVELAFDRASATTAAAGAAACVALAWRRRAPLAVLAVALAATVIGDWGEEENAGVFVVALAGYTLGAHAPLRRAASGLAGASALVMTADVATGGDPSDAYFLVLMLGMPWLAGAVVRRYRERAAQLATLASQLEHERDLSADLARARERRRLTREVHHAVAAAIGGVLEPLRRAETGDAREALTAAQATGRAAIGELQSVLGALRTSAPPAAPARPPGAPAGRNRWPAWADAVLGAGLVALSLASALTSHLYVDVRAAAAVLAFAGLAVAVRRSRPVAALVVCTAAGTAETLLIGAYGELPAAFAGQLLAMYSLAERKPLRVSAGWLGAAVLTNAAVPLAQGYADPADLTLLALFDGVPWAAGLAARRLHRQAAELRRLTRQLVAERDARGRLAATEERARVARDLHDSIAHSVSVMVLQAGAAEDALERAPAAARQAIRAAAAQGERALEELAALLGLLDDAGAGDLGELVARVRRVGLPAELTVHGERRAVPGGVESTAYRIVQEALTNTLKHAGAVATTVTLDYAPDTLAVEVRDAGGHPGGAPGGGHGLAGMRERVAEHGGTLVAGPCADGGFAVRAELPLEEAR